MKTIGKVVKEARIKRKISKESLEKITKIKREFIDAIEKEDWERLPEYPVILGFVKNIAEPLKLSEDHLLALLRRDYIPRDLKINPKKEEISEKFVWTPRLTFFLGIVVIIFFVIGYLLSQYLNFIRPPSLLLEKPSEGEVVEETPLKVRGRTDPEATVVVNNQPVIVKEDGSFETELEIFKDTQEVVVVAKSRYGKERVVRHKIVVKI